MPCGICVLAVPHAIRCSGSLNGVLAAAVWLLLPSTLAADPRCFLSLSRCSFVLRYRRIVQVARVCEHADSLYYLRGEAPFFDDVAGDYFYSFMLVRWERRPRCSRPTCRVCG